MSGVRGKYRANLRATVVMIALGRWSRMLGWPIKTVVTLPTQEDDAT